MSDPLRILAISLILLGNAFFVAAEYALVTARRARLTGLAERGSRRAQAALELTHEPVRFVSTVQLGVTLFSILLGAVGQPLLEGWLAGPLAAGVAFAAALALLTFLHVVVGELVPKALALEKREQIALQVALPLRAFSLAAFPAVWLLEHAATLLTRPLGIAPPPAGVAVETEEDIRLLVAQAEEVGVIAEAEEEMLYKVFDFADKEVSDVMIPRPHVDAIPADAAPEACLAAIAATPHARYPVYRGSLDQLVGILTVYDFLAAVRTHGLAGVRVEDLVRPAYVVPETKDLGALLAELRRTGQEVAVVVDEYGTTQGIATLHDLLEEIVGEIASEYQLPDESLVRVDERTVLVDGTFPIDDFNEQLGLDLPREEYHTLAGFVFGQLGRAAAAEDEVFWDGIRFLVVSTEGARINRLEVRLERELEVSPRTDRAPTGSASAS